MIKVPNKLIKALLAILFVVNMAFTANAQKNGPEKYSRIRIYATEKEMKTLNDKGLIYITGVNRNPDFIDAEVAQKNVEVIKGMGHQLEVIVEDMTTHHIAQANLEKAAKGKKLKKAPVKGAIPTPIKKK